MPTATDFPPSIMPSKINEYQSVKEILTELESIFSDLAKEALDEEVLATFGCPKNAAVIYPCPYGGPILSEMDLPEKADNYLSALSDISITLNKSHSARISGFVKVCKIDMKILLSTDEIFAITVATKMKKIKTECSRMLEMIDHAIIAIKSAEEPVAVPELERAINSIGQEFGHLLDNIDKNEVLQQIVSLDFETAFKLRLKDWQELLGVSDRTIRKFPAWISFRERKVLLRSTRPQRSRPTRKKSTTNKPLDATTEPLEVATEPLATTTEPFETNTKPLEMKTEVLKTKTKPLATNTEVLETNTKR